MIRFDSRIMPALHSASDEIIYEKNGVIADLQKRERVAKMEIHKLERQVKTLERSNQDAETKEKTSTLAAKIEENKLKAEIKQQKIEIARLKEDVFRIKDDMNDKVERTKREADDRRQEDISGIERNFMKELDHIKSIHKMEKEQIEHRA
jgi:molecular chaperone GrpE (heat shock protein)